MKKLLSILFVMFAMTVSAHAASFNDRFYFKTSTVEDKLNTPMDNDVTDEVHITSGCSPHEILKKKLNESHLKYTFSSMSPLGMVILFTTTDQNGEWVLLLFPNENKAVACPIMYGGPYKSVLNGDHVDQRKEKKVK